MPLAYAADGALESTANYAGEAASTASSYASGAYNFAEGLYYQYSSSEDSGKISEEGESIILEVLNYEPKTIPASLIEEQDVPIYVKLGGIRSAPATMPKISFISFELLTEGSGKIENSTVGGTSEYVRRNYYKTYKYFRPLAYSLNDMGYLEIWLRQNTAEKKPKSIDLDFRAKIYYEAENLAALSGYLTGREFQVETEAEMRANLESHKLFDNYYVRVDSIKSAESSSILSRAYAGFRGNVATLKFYVYNPNTGSIELVSAYTVKEGATSDMIRVADSPYFRIKVDDIQSESTKFKFNIRDEEVTVGMNEKILNSEWYVAGYDVQPKYFSSKEYIILKNYAHANYFVIIANLEGIFGSGEITLTKGLKSLEGLQENFDIVCKNEKDICKVYRLFGLEEPYKVADYSAALDDLSKTFPILEYDKIESPVSGGISAQISTKLSPSSSYVEGTVLQQPYDNCPESMCKIVAISGDSIKVSPSEDSSCKEASKTVKVGEFLPCGSAKLIRIKSDQKVKITALPGSGKSISISDFSVHVPIEERAIELTPERIDKDINKSLAYIAKLDKSIIKLQGLVDQWTKVCLVTAAFFTVTSFFGGMAMPNKSTVSETATTEKKTIEVKSGKDYYYLKPDSTGKMIPTKLNPKTYSIVNGYVVNEAGTELFRVDSTNLIVFNEGVEPNKLDYSNSDTAKKIFERYYAHQDTGELMPVDSAKLDQFYESTMRFDGKNFVFAINSIGQLPDNLRNFYNEAQIYDKKLYVVYDSTKDRCSLWYGGQDKKISYMDGKSHPGESKVSDSFANCHQFRDQVISQIGNEQANTNQRSYNGAGYTLNTDALDMDNQPTCEQVLGSGSCKLLFNACDPVMCPSSRCNFGGKYQVENVIQSGLIGSLILCLPNIKQGVMMPVCLTGLLASLKNLKSVFQGYVDCLKTARIDKKSVGVCDKIRSVYLCEIVWKELVTLLNLKGGLLGRFFGSSPGGNEYLSGVSSGLQESKEFLSYFTQSYATTVFAAYKGRSASEIGTEVCRSAVMGKYPVIGDVLSEVSAGQDVSQFTAYFEEEPYSSTIRGNSRYQVYYHIYAGGNEVNYQVYLKKDGVKISFRENKGTLTPGAYVDKSIDFLGVSNAKEICVLINNEEKCGYGKIVSTSFAMNSVNDFMVKYQMSQNIKSEDQCHSETWASTLSSGILPNANVEKVCSKINPAAGYEKATEAQWVKVGTCGIKDSVDLGDCWMKISDVPKELAQAVKMDICEERGGNICLYNQKCDGAIEDVGTTVTCCKGQCVNADYYSGAEGFDAIYNSFNQDADLKSMFDASALVVDQNCQRINSGLDTYINLFSGLGNSELTGLVALRDSLEERRNSLTPAEQLQLDKIYLFYIMMYLKCKDCSDASKYLSKISIKQDPEFQTKLGISLAQTNSLIASCVASMQKPAETSSEEIKELSLSRITMKAVTNDEEKSLNFKKINANTFELSIEENNYYVPSGIYFTDIELKENEKATLSYGLSPDIQTIDCNYITATECKISNPKNIPLRDGFKFTISAKDKNGKEKTFTINVKQKETALNDNVKLCIIKNKDSKPLLFCMPFTGGVLDAYNGIEKCSDLEIKDVSIANEDSIKSSNYQCLIDCNLNDANLFGECLGSNVAKIFSNNLVYYKK